MALLKTCLHHVHAWEARSAGVHLSDISGVHSSWRSRYFWPWSFIYNLVSVVYCSSGQSTFGEQCKTAFEKQTCMYMDVYICTHWPFPAFRESSLVIFTFGSEGLSLEALFSDFRYQITIRREKKRLEAKRIRKRRRRRRKHCSDR